MPLPSQRPRTSRDPDRKSRNRKQKTGLNLPTEILLQITFYLPKSTWLSLRLVSRSLYAFSSHLPIITHLWYGPYFEDLSIFEHVCKHPFLGSHVTAVLYDITRFENFSMEEPVERWPRAPRRAREHRRQKRKEWIKDHPGLWQYLKLAEQGKSASFDCKQTLVDGLKKLPNVTTIRLAFAFQKMLFTTDKERLSPLRRYSDVEWVSRRRRNWKREAEQPHLDLKVVSNLLAAINESGVRIEELDFWRDYISIPLNAFNFGGRFQELSGMFTCLTSLTIKISRSGMENEPDVRSFRKLLTMAKGLRKLHLCIDFANHNDSFDGKETRTKFLRMLVDEFRLASMREIKWTDAPRLFGPMWDDMSEYNPPWPGSAWIFERIESR